MTDAPKDHRAACEELFRATGTNVLQENAQELLLMAGPLILHDNTRPLIADVVTKNYAIMGAKCYLMGPTVQTWVHKTLTYSQS